VDSTAIARQMASRLIAHRNKLAGKAEDAVLVQFALHQTTETIFEQREDHNKAASTALSHWDGTTSERFGKRSRRLSWQLRMTGEASRDAEQIVAKTTAALSGGHTTAQRLVDEFVTKAARTLDAGLAVSGAGAPAAIMKAVAEASDLENQYAKESVANLRRVNGELKEAARRLRALERDVEHDRVVDPGDRRHRGEGGRGGKADKPNNGTAGGGKPGGGKPGRTELVRDILSAARKEIGTRENPPGSNRNPYGRAEPWCAWFATAMWRKAGVNIPPMGFTGAVFEWGREHGKAYTDLSNVRPGDVLLFGTGPSSPSTSTHIGIVEKVENGMVTLIEGNSGDRVQRNTHQLSRSIFYGGVHP
jgi:peptidoglycan DL-endopeptidase CwlO